MIVILSSSCLITGIIVAVRLLATLLVIVVPISRFMDGYEVSSADLAEEIVTGVDDEGYM